VTSIMRTLFAPWMHPGRLFLALAHVALGLPLSIIWFTLVIVGLSLSAGLLPAFLIGIPVMIATFGLAHGLANVERSRAGSIDRRTIPNSLPPLTRPTFLGRVGERLSSGARWKEVGYHLLNVFPASIGYAVTIAAWSGALALLFLPAYLPALPGHTAHFHFFEIGYSGWLAAATATGLVGVAVVAPWVTIGVADLEVAMARKMLGPGGNAELVARAVRAESTRTAAVDAAETERRRIERDLHDGAQQRLVALAADLGAARERLAVDAEGGRELVASAHEEAKAALKEIRDLVRGIHPVILEDRGLDAALSAVVARSSVPVTLDVDMAQRPPAPVESAAYFVVSEALTNVTRHAHATRAWVSIARAGDRLVVEVRDDGIGGADADAGSGLQGLRDRVAALKGWMSVISPPGGPTTITVELPCAS
jgi:signal transduction histidine kinase